MTNETSHNSEPAPPYFRFAEYVEAHSSTSENPPKGEIKKGLWQLGVVDSLIPVDDVVIEVFEDEAANYLGYAITLKRRGQAVFSYTYTGMELTESVGDGEDTPVNNTELLVTQLIDKLEYYENIGQLVRREPLA